MLVQLLKKAVLENSVFIKENYLWGIYKTVKKKKKNLKKNTFNLPSKVVFVKFLCCWIKDFSIQNISFSMNKFLFMRF